MIGIEERRTALLIQASLIRKELDNLRRPEETKCPRDNKGYSGLAALVDSLEIEEK